MIPIGKIYQRTRQFIFFKILHADDTPHRLALGIALGMFVGLTPTVGFQMIIVLLLASVVKANKLVGLPMVWITNPLTIPPVYFFNYVLGRYLISSWSGGHDMSYAQMRELMAKVSGAGFTELFTGHFWREFSGVLMTVGLELWVGSVVVGLLAALIIYLVSFRVINWYRSHTPLGRLHVRRMLLRRKRRQSREAKERSQADKLQPPSDDESEDPSSFNSQTG